MITSNAMVAVVDILGFSKLVKSKSLDRIVGNASYLLKALSSAINKENTPENTPTLSELRDQHYIGFAWFSDTMLFYTLNDQEADYQNLIQTMSWLITHTVLDPEMRLRAGIAYGEFFCDAEKGIYVGKAIVDAYKLEKRQEWCGGALTESARGKISKEYWDGKFADWPIAEYDVPVKYTGAIAYRPSETYETVLGRQKKLIERGQTERLLAINWTFIGKCPICDEEPIFKDVSDNSRINQKLRNTKKFHDQVCREWRIYSNPIG